MAWGARDSLHSVSRSLALWPFPVFRSTLVLRDGDARFPSLRPEGQGYAPAPQAEDFSRSAITSLLALQERRAAPIMVRSIRSAHISLPFTFMQWIANTIGKLFTKDEGPVCVMRLTQDDVRLNVSEYLLPCGHPGFMVELEYHLEPDTWIPVASLRDFNLDASMQLLQDAKRCIGNLSE